MTLLSVWLVTLFTRARPLPFPLSSLFLPLQIFHCNCQSMWQGKWQGVLAIYWFLMLYAPSLTVFTLIFSHNSNVHP